MRNRFRWL